MIAVTAFKKLKKAAADGQQSQEENTILTNCNQLS
jgi:hypothetical protein